MTFQFRACHICIGDYFQAVHTLTHKNGVIQHHIARFVRFLGTFEVVWVLSLLANLSQQKKGSNDTDLKMLISACP